MAAVSRRLTTRAIRGTWQLQYVTPEGTRFGPGQTVSGEGDDVNLAPSFGWELGRGGQELLFDYDTEGRRGQTSG